MSLIFLILSILPRLPFEGKITLELQEQLAAAQEQEKIEVIIYMRERYPYDDVAHLTIQEKARIFQNIAHASQQSLVEYLEQFSEDVTDITQFWVFNGMYVKATKAIIETLVQRRDVWYISANSTITLPPVEKGEYIPTRAIEWNIQKVMADSCWLAGYTGEDVFIGHIDTGIDTSHPALAGNWSGKWKDFIDYQSYPYDDHGHGTHTAGVLCGGDGFGPFTEDIGIAPKVKIITAKVFTQSGSPPPYLPLEGMQWMAALKADSGYDIRAISNSWGSNNTMDLTYWETCNTLKTLEILSVFSIGPNGPDSGTAGIPGNYPLVLGAGATDNNDNLVSSSSRGPAPDTIPWNNSDNWYRPDWNLIKPDLSAPGVNVRSCWPSDSYVILSGPSHAPPHIAGAVAILCQANPNLTPTELYNILLDNADHPPQGAPYPNNNYGWGRLNVWRALQAVVGIKEQETKTVKNNFVLPTVIKGSLHLPQNIEYKIFDILGKEVKQATVQPGIYFFIVDTELKQKIIVVR